MVECSDILEEHTASIVRVTELVWVDAEVIARKGSCRLYKVICGNSANHRYGGHEEGIGFSMGIQISRIVLLNLSSVGSVKHIWMGTVVQSLSVVKLDWV